MPKYDRSRAHGKWAPRVLPFKVIQGHWNRQGSICYIYSVSDA